MFSFHSTVLSQISSMAINIQMSSVTLILCIQHFLHLYHNMQLRADCSTATNYVSGVGNKVKQSHYTPCRRLGGEEYSSYSFTASALDGGEWSASRLGLAFTPGERTPGTHCTGGWVGPRAGLDTEDRGKILCPCRGSNPDRPVFQPVVRHYTA
jgi:hypothetical protein